MMSTVAILETTQPAVSADVPPASGANPLIEWLMREGWDMPCPHQLVAGLAARMNGAGIPVYRIRVHIRTLHPQFIGIVYAWQQGWDEVREITPEHAIVEEERYIRSPYAAIFQGAGGIRRRLDAPGVVLDFPVLTELRGEGATDYVAMPLVFSDGRINAVTLASKWPGGFSTAELEMAYGMLPVLARVMELHATRRMAQTILETYLGAQTGQRVLEGQIRRGDGQDIHAVIWFSDMRGSTALADRMPRPDYLNLLNSYFECMAGAILDHGGEVLRFLGDAVLGIFTIGAVTDQPKLCPEHTGACSRSLEAARDAMTRMEDLNKRRVADAKLPLGYGIALHLGDLMYGNIGVAGRLDFTAIGAAVNEAARLEDMCKSLDKPILISAELAGLVPEQLVSLGVHGLRGVREPHEIFTLPGL
jgi:adenylate cyclase